jgi:plastocyanin
MQNSARLFAARLLGLRAAAGAILLLPLAAFGTGAELKITVSGSDGKPVGDVVATATPMLAPAQFPRERRSAVMDQVNKAFVPQVLVVGQGTWVEFPNSDTVSHQVYSFSAAKKFQLPLYKGVHRAPVQFDNPGLVVLGCNIHDSMVGYIYVADTPYFGKTDAAGNVLLTDLSRGRYRVIVWSPRVADEPGLLRRDIDVDNSGTTDVEFKLGKSLRATPEPRPHPQGWDAY